MDEIPVEMFDILKNAQEHLNAEPVPKDGRLVGLRDGYLDSDGIFHPYNEGEDDGT